MRTRAHAYLYVCVQEEYVTTKCVIIIIASVVFLDLFFFQLSVVQAAPMEVRVLLQTLVPVFHNGLEPRVPVVS